MSTLGTALKWGSHCDAVNVWYKEGIDVDVQNIRQRERVVPCDESDGITGRGNDELHTEVAHDGLRYLPHVVKPRRRNIDGR